MLKPVIAAAVVLAVAGSSFVYAQQRFGDHGFGDGGFRFAHRRHFSADDMAAFADARIAALKAGLELTADQSKNWPAFEAALRSMAQLRIERMQARQAAAANQDGQTPTPSSPFDRLARRAERMSKASAALKQIADSGTPLYQSLTDAQKARFTVLARILVPHRHMRASNGGGEGSWRQGYGDGRGWWGHGGRRFGQNERGGDNDLGNQGGDTDQGSRL